MVIENVVSSSTGKFSARKRNPNQDDEFWLLTEKMIQSEIENEKKGRSPKASPQFVSCFTSSSFRGSKEMVRRQDSAPSLSHTQPSGQREQ